MKVSVVIPVYNSSKYIRKCIDSLISQTLEDSEFIFVDNGSTDNSAQIIKSYKDKRIKYHKLKEKGLSLARNYGIKKSVGDTIYFMDSDDYADKNMLELMYNKLHKDNLDIVICDYYTENLENGNLTENNLISFENTTLRETPNLINSINLGPCNKLYKSSLLKDEEFPIGIKYEDFALVCRLFDKAKLIGKIDKKLCYFTYHQNSETTTMDDKVFDIFISLDNIVDYFKEKDYMSDAVETLIIDKLTQYMGQQRFQKDKKIRNEFIDKSFNYMKMVNKRYKSNVSYNKYNFIKRFILRNKFILKIYCNLHSVSS